MRDLPQWSRSLFCFTEHLCQCELSCWRMLKCPIRLFFNELRVLLLMRSGSSGRTDEGTDPDAQARMRGLAIGGCVAPESPGERDAIPAVPDLLPGAREGNVQWFRCECGLLCFNVFCMFFYNITSSNKPQVFRTSWWGFTQKDLQ